MSTTSDDAPNTVVYDITDITPRFNHPAWKSKAPPAGSLVAFTTTVRLQLSTMHSDTLLLESPVFGMIFIAQIDDTGTAFRARVCEPNLARSITVARSRDERWPAYWRRMIINAWTIGTRIEAPDAIKIFHSLAADYGLRYLDS